MCAVILWTSMVFQTAVFNVVNHVHLQMFHPSAPAWLINTSLIFRLFKTAVLLLFVIIMLLFYSQGLVSVCWCYLIIACVAAISRHGKVLPGKLKAGFLLVFLLFAWKRFGQILIRWCQLWSFEMVWNTDSPASHGQSRDEMRIDELINEGRRKGTPY